MKSKRHDGVVALNGKDQMATYHANKNPEKTASLFSSDYVATIKCLFAVFILISVGFSAYHCTQSAIDPDELQHLHAAWLWDQGLIPYRDFFEHHPPLHWLILRPIVHTNSRDLLSVLRSARLLSWIMAALLLLPAWWLLAILLGRKAAWNGTALLALYLAISNCLTEVRPDGASLLATVAGTAMLLEAMGWGKSKRISTWRCILASTVLATGVLIHTKAIIWVFMLVLTMGLLAILEARGGNRSLLKAAAWTIAGGLGPVVCALAWIVCCNDFTAVWRCNIQENGPMLGSLLRHAKPFSNTWDLLTATPALSLPLAVLGTVYLLGGPVPWPRKLLTVLLLMAGVLLVLLGIGPFAQNHLYLQLMLAALGGLGVAMALAILSEHAQRWAIAALVAIMLLLQVVLVGFRHAQPMSDLQLSLTPMQYVLDTADADDRFQAIVHWNPVLMMDAEPKMNARLVCTFTPEWVAEMQNVIQAKRPRFVIGLGTNVWTSEGTIEGVPPWQDLQENYKPPNPSDIVVLERLPGH